MSEVLFGLIMVLTFTGSLSVATGEDTGPEAIREMLIGAIGCNIAWGIVDAIMYLMNCVTERARGRAALRAVRTAANPRLAHQVIADAVPEVIASTLDEPELEKIRVRLVASRDAEMQAESRRLVNNDEWLGALGVFLLVFLCTFPVVLPFMFMDQAHLALRISNGIAIVMLFGSGYALGKFAGVRPWLVGVIMVIVGTALAGMTLALGG